MKGFKRAGLVLAALLFIGISLLAAIGITLIHSPAAAATTTIIVCTVAFALGWLVAGFRRR